MQIVFQDPFASLNPRMTIYEIIGEPFDIHGHAKGDEKRKRINELMTMVGLPPSNLNRYPHQFKRRRETENLNCQSLGNESEVNYSR